MILTDEMKGPCENCGGQGDCAKCELCFIVLFGNEGTCEEMYEAYSKKFKMPSFELFRALYPSPGGAGFAPVMRSIESQA